MSNTRYQVILADPPWDYRKKNSNGTPGDHYSTMSIDDICAMPIGDMALDDAVLILWCTWPQISEGLRVIEAWGFEYKTGFPWVKLADGPFTDLFGNPVLRPSYGIGTWMRGCTEPILLAVRGNIKPGNPNFVGLLSQRFEHSRKPDDIYQYCQQWPGPYLELFARRKREGWDSWGNEIESDVRLRSYV